MTQTEYKIISDRTTAAVEKEVNALLKQGWIVNGALSVAAMPHVTHQAGYFIYSQALTKTVT